MRIAVACILVAIGGTPALADELATNPKSAEPSRPIAVDSKSAEPWEPVAVGVNVPFRWPDGNSIAVSLSVGLAKHHAIRANVASYEYTDAIGDAVAALAGGENESSRSGRITDVGIGYVNYSRELWSGFMLEVGALRRAKDISARRDDTENYDTKSTTYSGRVMIGWSWLISHHVFVAAAVGASFGLERGSEITRTDSNPAMPVTTDVDRATGVGEAYLRIGGLFGR
ncbi:MAG: hypothetical protein ABI867_33440 [Kofleriaceae bacterium]